MAHVLFTPRLRLEPANPADVELLVGLGEPQGAPDPERVDRIRALVEANAERFLRHGFGLWLVRAGAAAVGWVGLRPRETALEPELLYGLARQGRGMGYASEAAGAVIDRLFGARDVTGVWAVTDPTNLASCRVLERIGLKLEFEGDFDGRPSRVYRMKRSQWRDPLRAGAGRARRR